MFNVRSNCGGIAGYAYSLRTLGNRYRKGGDMRRGVFMHRARNDLETSKQAFRVKSPHPVSSLLGR